MSANCNLVAPVMQGVFVLKVLPGILRESTATSQPLTVCWCTASLLGSK